MRREPLKREGAIMPQNQIGTPLTLKQGESQGLGDIVVTYLTLMREGPQEWRVRSSALSWEWLRTGLFGPLPPSAQTTGWLTSIKVQRQDECGEGKGTRFGVEATG